MIVLQDTQNPVGIKADDGGIDHDFDQTLESLKIINQFLGNVETTGLRVLLFRAEKHMRLFDQLTAQTMVSVNDQHFLARFRGHFGGAKPGWAPADDD
jgi:hypothetical protein